MDQCNSWAKSKDRENTGEIADQRGCCRQARATFAPSTPRRCAVMTQSVGGTHAKDALCAAATAGRRRGRPDSTRYPRLRALVPCGNARLAGAAIFGATHHERSAARTIVGLRQGGPAFTFEGNPLIGNQVPGLARPLHDKYAHRSFIDLSGGGNPQGRSMWRGGIRWPDGSADVPGIR